MWCSLVQDYLAIMASSVASECTFSSASITISKCHNCLDADIVKALQCFKSLILCKDLMLRTFPSIAKEEVNMDNADLQCPNQEATLHDVINDKVEWDFEAIAEDAGIDDDNSDKPWIVVD
jgi:hypothetical protein